MVAPRPVDQIHLRDRMEALRQRVCVGCGEDVDEADLCELDAREYRISAQCPACFDDATKDCEE